jgi:hypothetical protein
LGAVLSLWAHFGRILGAFLCLWAHFSAFGRIFSEKYRPNDLGAVF